MAFVLPWSVVTMSTYPSADSGHTFSAIFLSVVKLSAVFRNFTSGKVTMLSSVLTCECISMAIGGVLGLGLLTSTAASCSPIEFILLERMEVIELL